MAEYRFKASQLKRVFVLPKEIVDRHLRLAGSVQLKVLLWLSRNGGEFDEQACAKAVGVSAPDCADALQYWVAAGVLLPENDDQPAAPAPVKEEKLPEVPPKPMARPAAVKPQMTEVLKKQKANKEFSYLIEAVSARLGRPLANGDAETLLYLFETAGLPAAVIMMVVEYAAQAGRFTMRYIEKVALDWADQGIMTMSAAEEHLCFLERCAAAAAKVQTLCGLTRPITTAANLRTAEKWVYQWQVEEALLKEAYTISMDKTRPFQYMDRVLDNWRMQEITTLDQLKALQKGTQKSTANSEENREYEDMVEQYIPVYKKKKR